MRILPLASSLSLLVAGTSYANGLEPPVGASAQHAAVGGAAASSVNGADAIILNPAGLARAKGFQVTASAMPVLAKASAPITAPDTSVSSRSSIAPLAELSISYMVMEGLSFAVGFNAAGGLGADYGNVQIGPFAMAPEISQKLGALELSIGGGYAITENLSVGAAWRISHQMGDIRTAAPGPMGTLQALSIAGATGTNLDGFRFGAQLATEDGAHGIGAVVRTPVRWTLEGDGSVIVSDTTTAFPSMDIGPVSTSMVFPLQLALGGHVTVLPGLKIFGQYSFSDYSTNEAQELTMAGMTQRVALDWRNRHTMHAGAEYHVLPMWSVRAGFVHETAVVPTDKPSIYTPPAAANTFALGTGVQIGESWQLDAAFMYSKSAARGTPGEGSPAMAGEYSLDSYVAALTAAYRM